VPPKIPLLLMTLPRTQDCEVEEYGFET